MRMTILAKRPLIKAKDGSEAKGPSGSLGTYTIPPLYLPSKSNLSPIRIYQQDYRIDACPKGSHLIMFSTVLN